MTEIQPDHVEGHPHAGKLTDEDLVSSLQANPEAYILAKELPDTSLVLMRIAATAQRTSDAAEFQQRLQGALDAQEGWAQELAAKDAKIERLTWQQKDRQEEVAGVLKALQAELAASQQQVAELRAALAYLDDCLKITHEEV